MALVKAGSKWLAKKILNALNTGFFGYEIGTFLSEPKQETIYNTTIIQTAPKEQQDDSHFDIVIAFLVLIVFLICILWVLRVAIKVRASRGNEQIELQAIPANHSTA